MKQLFTVSKQDGYVISKSREYQCKVKLGTLDAIVFFTLLSRKSLKEYNTKQITKGFLNPKDLGFYFGFDLTKTNT